MLSSPENATPAVARTDFIQVPSLSQQSTPSVNVENTPSQPTAACGCYMTWVPLGGSLSSVTVSFSYLTLYASQHYGAVSSF